MLYVQESKKNIHDMYVIKKGRYFHCDTVCVVNEVRQLLNDFDPALVLKNKQIECYEHILSGKDVFVNLPVEYGKSLVYQLLPGIMNQSRDRASSRDFCVGSG